MILITRGSNFLGRALGRRLISFEQPIRLLLEPNRLDPGLPRGQAVEVAVTSLDDIGGVRAAMIGADTLIHLGLSSLEAQSRSALEQEGVAAQVLVAAAGEAGVERLIFVSQLGADRASAFPSLRASAEAEEAFRKSGLPYAILRTSVLFGEGDQLTTGLAQVLGASPLLFPVPGDGEVILQPLWVEDLAIALTWLLEEDKVQGVVYEVGGPEYLTLREVLRLIMRVTGILRITVPLRPPYLRALGRMAGGVLPYMPLTEHWLDYLAASRTTDLNAMPAALGLAPARMEEHLDYLRDKHWGWELLRRQRRGGG